MDFVRQSRTKLTGSKSIPSQEAGVSRRRQTHNALIHVFKAGERKRRADTRTPSRRVGLWVTLNSLNGSDTSQTQAAHQSAVTNGSTSPRRAQADGEAD